MMAVALGRVSLMAMQVPGGQVRHRRGYSPRKQHNHSDSKRNRCSAQAIQRCQVWREGAHDCTITMTTPLNDPRSSVVIFVVQVGERNVMDQRMIEFELWDRHKVPVVRITLGEVTLFRTPSHAMFTLFVPAGVPCVSHHGRWAVDPGPWGVGGG